ncbi:MAG TPA: ZIP family metal transporter [Longimicrobiaceae bacterium]|nr:ZIP family metal transporter [Longimicrobiaceae bacterium]
MSAALLYALVAAAANLAGGLLITAASPATRAPQRLLIAFGAGFMLAAALLGMVPHALEERGAAAATAILVGYLLVHLTQHVLTPHFHFGEETHHDAMVGRWVGVTALAGLLLHTFFDGVAIASAFQVGAWLGLLVWLAILLHKVPEGVTVASIMLASGNSRRRAIAAVLLLGAFTVLGVLLTRWVRPLAAHGLALSAGVTLYVGASNLVPEVQKGRGLAPALAVFLGAGLYWAASAMLQGYLP